MSQTPDQQVPPTASAPQHTRQRKSTGQPGQPRQLNMTSMIDVVFQLLIYFIITSAFIPGEGVLHAQMPGGQDPVPRIQEPIKIRVTSLGETGYRLDLNQSATRPATFGDLARMLEDLHEDRGGVFATDTPVIIEATDNVRWQHVVNAFNAGLRARYSNIAFAQDAMTP